MVCKGSDPVDVRDEEEMAKICDEITKLDWINRALKKQIEFNEVRIRTLSRCLSKEFLEERGIKNEQSGNQSGCRKTEIDISANTDID